KLCYHTIQDDSLWDTAKYIRRMDERLKSRPHTCKYSIYLYEHGTHFVFPESVLKKALPVGADLLVKMSFSAAKKFPAECKAMRVDLDKQLSAEIVSWKNN
ncbi:MAG TPA: acyl-CoA thioester hydrolase, partial [Ruminococcaceae bacterium]|nr:acyl-CoA thioester hydrolase [Oscillospiraceae bacterium]